MQCTYAVTLSTKKWTNETLEQCVAAITNWLPKNHDHLPANLRVRVRPLGDDDVFRAELQNTYAAGVDSILITLAALSGQLVFDLRERRGGTEASIGPSSKTCARTRLDDDPTTRGVRRRTPS
jgi:hypothetical protein